MAIVKSQKFLPSSSSSSLVVRSKNISSRSFTDATPGTGNKKIFTLKKKIIKIDEILKGTLASEKKSIDQKKKEEQRKKRKSNGKSLEAKPKEKEGGLSGLKIPTPSFFDRIKDFFKNIIAGYILTRLVDLAKYIEPFLPAIETAFDWTTDFVIGLVDGLGTFLVWGEDAANSSKEFLKDTFGEDAVARFNELGDKLFHLFNAIVLVGMTSAAVRDPKKPRSEAKPSKNVKPTNFVTKNVSECIIPPNSFVLARTVEKFKIPNDVLVICLGKSTYARCGIIVNVTPLEPGWEGYVTLEFSNTTPLPAKIYANEGVAQFIFLKGNEKPEVTYADRNGKYMGQTGVTLPKV